MSVCRARRWLLPVLWVELLISLSLCLLFCVSSLFFQIGLPPILAAACMGLSSTSVIVSSLWLKRYRKPVLVHGEEASGPTHARPQALAKLIGAVGGARRGGSRSSRRSEGYDPMAQQQDSEDDFMALPVDAEADADDVRTPDINEHLGIEVPASAMSMTNAQTTIAATKRQPLQALGPTRMPPRVKMLPLIASRRAPMGSPLLSGPRSPPDVLSDADDLDGTPRASNYAAPSVHITTSA